MTAPSFAAAPAADVQLAGLTVAESIGLYVGCPLALFVIIAGLVFALTKPDKKI
ncbi:hypothetical protein [Streptacidiphilus sp. P02-A3a]|uniref:hypothetical protein n=1 Tax=Streptacidiphilus sp. P02-A3a TaxID=2704468 RepID=UPI00351A636A